jgi:general secretion pathway protein B
MSYILDALRKSEQQRQAMQPDTVKERIRVSPWQPKQKPTQWMIALAVGNLLVIAYLIWFLTQKEPEQAQRRVAVITQEKQPIEPVKPNLPQTVTEQDADAINIKQQNIKQEGNLPTLPSIAQLLEEKQAAIKIVETQKATQQTQAKKPITVKKELLMPKLNDREFDGEPIELPPKKPVNLSANKGTPNLNELPYDFRNSLPNLTINVFSYAHQPEDRFVIIDMVKYRSGQLIKGVVTLKEIRPDSIVLQYRGDTFKVERP